MKADEPKGFQPQFQVSFFLSAREKVKMPKTMVPKPKISKGSAVHWY